MLLYRVLLRSQSRPFINRRINCRRRGIHANQPKGWRDDVRLTANKMLGLLLIKGAFSWALAVSPSFSISRVDRRA